MSVFYVGITDTNWFNLLKSDFNERKLGKYINFWTPGTKEFKALEPGDLFLFKLHNRKTTGEKGEIVGGAFFSHFEKQTIDDAWKKYGRGNGRESLQIMKESLQGMRHRNNLQSTANIGCIILQDAFFLEKWFDEPSDWDKNIVSGKKYDTNDVIGDNLYRKVWDTLKANTKTDEQIVEEIENEIDTMAVKGEERIALVKVRANQSVFRERLLARYHHCCLCNVENQALLIASHIKPWVASAADEKLDSDNGFLLCPNHDALFDGGYISFEDDGKIIISDRLSQKDCIFTNVFSGMHIELTDKNKKYLAYHRKNIFANKAE